MSRKRVLGLLGLLGGLLGILLAIAFSTTEFGYPGTAAYRTYETLNRLTGLPLLLMACGWLGLALTLPPGNGRTAAWLACASSVVMAVGTAAEFWFFSDQPYGVWNNGRMVSYMAFFISLLLLTISATVAGVFLWRSGAQPRWCAAVLMMAVPLYFASVFILATNFLAPALLALVVGWLLMHGVRAHLEEGRHAGLPLP